MRISDWSLDLCSSELQERSEAQPIGSHRRQRITHCRAMKIAFRSLHSRACCRTRCRSRCPPTRSPIWIRRRLMASSGTWRPKNIWSASGRPKMRSEEHTSELQSLMRISYAVFCLKKKLENNHMKKQNKEH